MKKDGIDKTLVLGGLLAIVAFGLAVRPRRGPEGPRLEAVVVGEASYKLDFREGKILVADAHGEGEVEIDANVVVDGTLRPLAGPTSGTDTARIIDVTAGDVKLKVAVRLEDGLLRARVQDPDALAPHRVELRFALTPASTVWVPGAGELATGDRVLANAAILGSNAHPLVIAAPFGAKIALETEHADLAPAEDAAAALEPEDGGSDAGDAGASADAGFDDGLDAGENTTEIEELALHPSGHGGRLVITTERLSLPEPSSDDAGVSDGGLRRDGGPRDASAPRPDASPGTPGATTDLDAGDSDNDDSDPEDPEDGGAIADSGNKPVLPPTTLRRRPKPELVVFFGPSSEGTYGQLFRILGQRVAKVSGRVTGATGGVTLYGIDDSGHPQVRAKLGPESTFSVEAPMPVDHWYALQGTSASPPIRFPPGTGWPLVLDLSPGGELTIRVVDVDTKNKVPSRLWVHGIDGTLDPSFGPDFRASGAGPLIDTLAGELTTPLPKGRYRVEATHGLEWNVDARTIEIKSGKRETVELSLRHVVATPHLVGCDLHVHARPSFDSLVPVEDRVTTLVTAGVEFAVPTEHNIAGDYGPTTEALSLTRDFSSVSGVEVTTYGPRYGHFGVFPYPTDQKVPPFRQVRAGQMFEAARKTDPSRVIQVNHPRLPKGIGYFTIAGFDPKTGVVPVRMRADFDTIEVYNGYEIQNGAQVESVLKDWLSLLAHGRRYAATGSSDSHTVQYNWAGYPRTLVRQDEEAAGEPGHPADPKAIVAAIKAGRSIVTSGPILELTVEGGRPGDDVTLQPGSDSATAHLRVTAAPWVDVTDIEVLLDGKTFTQKAVPSRPTAIGPEPGTLAEVRARAVRYEANITIPLTPGPHFVVAVARGTRKADDVLPFMPFAPMGFTNPVWVTRSPQNAP